MNRLPASIAIAVVALTAFALTSRAASVKSGLAPGKIAVAFSVKDITGPNQGERGVCYRCTYENRPTVCIIIRQVTDEVGDLVQQIDRAVEANKARDLKAFVVLLTDDAESSAKELRKFAETRGIRHVPLTIFDGPSGLRSYKITEEAAVTVLMWKKAVVAVNHAFDTAKLSPDEIKTIVGDTAKILN